ncbi:ATP-binding protein [Parabacteroides pacaensis]|uniref:hypothetical protein n=1 Tax=Parabacteroides pacaensis TaxID=2086575 RepID=UPI000D0EC70F|nr:hypothetical protein [Parabacteroides pacaensis]
MKKKKLIPERKSFPKIGTPIKKVTEVEKIPMSQIFEEAKFDRSRMAFLVNVIFSLSDIIHGLAIDAESELKNVDPGLRLELRHPIERIKIHASEMVRFVDEKTSESFSEGFGEASDEMRELILGYYSKLMKK